MKKNEWDVNMPQKYVWMTTVAFLCDSVKKKGLGSQRSYGTKKNLVWHLKEYDKTDVRRAPQHG